jgi:DNA-binding NtrC family response regulator
MDEARKIVIVDDDTVTSGILAEAVRSAGYEVECTGNVADCLAIIDRADAGQGPSAVVLDIVMPQADGFDLMRALASRRCRVPLIIMTAFGDDYLKLAREFGRMWGLTVLDTFAKPLPRDRLVAHLEALRAAGPAAETEDRKLVVLFVDDDADIRYVAATALQDAGFEVLEAANGTEALDQIRQHDRVDVLFSDIDMPGMNGITLALAAEKLRPNMRIILTSGKTDEPPMADRPFVAKPYRPGQIIRAIEAALAS